MTHFHHPDATRRRLLAAAGLLPFVPFAPFAPLAHAQARPGTHGMALFGDRAGLYASHLPMFHAPHDVQLVLRIRLEDARADAALRRELAARPRLFTLEPERFDLQRLAPGAAEPLVRFAARPFDGHFERGGKPYGVAQAVAVDEVLLFNDLAAITAPGDSAGRYLAIPAGRPRFLVKRIDRRPDFDAIVALGETSGARVDELALPTADLRAPAPRAIAAALARLGVRVKGAPRVLYFETDDLR